MIWLSILVMAICTYLIRVIPLTLFRRPIQSPFFRSFLYYVPYVTLAVMTVPAITKVTQAPLAGILALIAGIVSAWHGFKLFPVALICSTTVLIIELILC